MVADNVDQGGSAPAGLPTAVRSTNYPLNAIEQATISESWLLDAIATLGDPAPNAPKWFAAVEMIWLAVDQDWLHKATKKTAKYWRHKRERQQLSPMPIPTARQ